MNKLTHKNAPTFQQHIRDVIHNIRGSLTELMASVGADPSLPQEVARTIGINRNLAWKMSKIITAEEPLGTIAHLPGPPGVRILLDTFARAGAPADARQRVHDAMTEFERAVEEHTGDRATLELMIGPMLPPHLQREREEVARRLAYQGQSAVWGIQARVRLSTYFVAPNPDDPTMIDTVTVGGLVGYRRLRDGISWPLLRVVDYDDDGRLLNASRAPIDASIADSSEAPILREFSNGSSPEIRGVPCKGGVQYELGEGPVGNHGLSTTIFGFFTRRFAPCMREKSDDTGEFVTHWFTPAENALCDLIVHRNLAAMMPPRASIHGRLTHGPEDPTAGRDRERLALPETVQALGGEPPVLSTPLIPEYPRMIQAAFDRLDWNPRDFIAWRFLVRYPPVPSLAVLQFPLLERPKPTV